VTTGAKKRSDQFAVGDTYADFEFTVTREFNENFCQSLEDFHPRYMEFGPDGKPPIVHTGLLINFSNLTRSPSFSLPAGMAAIHTHEEVTYGKPVRVGTKIKVSWTVVEVYEKRGKWYQVLDCPIRDEQGDLILRRKSTNTFFGQPKST